MSNVFLLAHIVAADKTSRETIIDALEKVAAHAKQHEPDTLHYALALARENDNNQDLWLIEEYTSQAALDTHQSSQPYADLMTFSRTHPDLFAAPTTLHTADLVQGYTRPALASAPEPCIAVASLTYKPGKRAEALVGWTEVAQETERNEDGALGYGVYKSREQEEVVRTFEAYRTHEYFKEVHIKSQAVRENREKYGTEIRVGMEHVWLRVVGGWLGRG